MTWQRRLIELACAGGALTGCFYTHDPIPCGNANPDPCICGRSPPGSEQCIAEQSCRDNGGEWVFLENPPASDAGGTLWGHCETPGCCDGGIDALPDAASHD
jgi:hypothetical protein